jgi:DNA polymerase-3 subunit gamma/tau
VVGVPVRVQPIRGTEAAPRAASAVLVPTEEGDFWHATVRGLVEAEAITALVRELALQSQLVARDTDHWMLRVERESLNQPAAASAWRWPAGRGPCGQLAVEVGQVTDSPARRNAAAAAERQLRGRERIIFDDPFVQSMMRDFGAKIVPGSIKPL